MFKRYIKKYIKSFPNRGFSQFSHPSTSFIRHSPNRSCLLPRFTNHGRHQEFMLDWLCHLRFVGYCGSMRGSDIAAMSFLFLGQPLDHIAITDITFTNDPSGSNSGISPSNVVVREWYNAQHSATLPYNSAPIYAVSDSYTYSQSVTTSFAESILVEMSGESFGIGAKATNEYTCKHP